MLLTDETVNVLRTWLDKKEDDTDWRFPSPFSSHRHHAGWREYFDRARELAGLPEFPFHGLRYSCVSYMVQAGVPDLIIASVVNHKTLHVTQRCAHLREGGQGSALKRADWGTGSKAADREISKLFWSQNYFGVRLVIFIVFGGDFLILICGVAHLWWSQKYNS